MTGDRRSYKQRGLIPRTIAATLSQLSTAPGLSSWSVSLSYLEIYNEALFDLLDINTQPHELAVYEDARGQTQVKEQCIQSRVCCPSMAMKPLAQFTASAVANLESCCQLAVYLVISVSSS